MFFRRKLSKKQFCDVYSRFVKTLLDIAEALRTAKPIDKLYFLKK